MGLAPIALRCGLACCIVSGFVIQRGEILFELRIRFGAIFLRTLTVMASPEQSWGSTPFGGSKWSSTVQHSAMTNCHSWSRAKSTQNFIRLKSGRASDSGPVGVPSLTLLTSTYRRLKEQNELEEPRHTSQRDPPHQTPWRGAGQLISCRFISCEPEPPLAAIRENPQGSLLW